MESLISARMMEPILENTAVGHKLPILSRSVLVSNCHFAV
jgi:hypothetical protein